MFYQLPVEAEKIIEEELDAKCLLRRYQGRWVSPDDFEEVLISGLAIYELRKLKNGQ